MSGNLIIKLKVGDDILLPNPTENIDTWKDTINPETRMLIFKAEYGWLFIPIDNIAVMIIKE